jgi:phage gp29-like protein
MGATSKRAKKIRSAREFDLVRLAAEIRPQKFLSGVYAWDLDMIRTARDAQAIGNFRLSAPLATAQRCDYALFVAALNRLAPQRGLPVRIDPPNDTARALRVADEAEALFGARGVGIHPDSLADINLQLADHGVAFGVNVHTPRADGSRVDIEMKAWPIQWVWWDSVRQAFRTRTESGEETITHGDGRWVVIKQHELEPWKFGATLSTATVWADHAFGVRDRAKASTAHGNAKIVGTMPPEVPMQTDDGELTRDAAAFLELLKSIASVDMPVGIKPNGAVLDYIVNNSQAWQIFKEIIESNDKAASKIYLGQDDTTTSVGGDGVKFLFGVRNDIVEGDLRAIERGIRTGVIEVWTAINYGDSTLAPDRTYLMPDADEDARRTSLSDRTKAFFETIKAAKEAGFPITQAYVDGLAKDYGVRAPQLVIAPVAAPATAVPNAA